MSSDLSRLRSVDFLRGVAIIAMFATHSFRNELNTREAIEAWPTLERLFQTIMTGEASISATFVMLAGFSVAWAEADPKSSLKRAAQLWGFSLVLSFFEHGLQWPHALTFFGILFLIAFAIVLVSALMRLPEPRVGFLLGWAFVLGLAALLERSLLGPPVEVSRSSELIPMIGFALIGAFIASCYRSWGVRFFAYSLPTFLFAGGISLLIPGEWAYETTVFFNDWGPGNPGMAFLRSLGGDGAPSVVAEPLRYWNYNNSSLGALRLSAILGAILLGLLWLEARFSKLFKPAGGLILLGQNALVLYVAHLVLLMLLEAYGIHCAHALHTLSLLFGLIGLGYAFARIKKAWPLAQ
jgi:hypothetical protein